MSNETKEIGQISLTDVQKNSSSHLSEWKSYKNKSYGYSSSSSSSFSLYLRWNRRAFLFFPLTRSLSYSRSFLFTWANAIEQLTDEIMGNLLNESIRRWKCGHWLVKKFKSFPSSREGKRNEINSFRLRLLIMCQLNVNKNRRAEFGKFSA